MRFATLSTILYVLALGYVSAQEGRGAHNQACGVRSESCSYHSPV